MCLRPLSLSQGTSQDTGFKELTCMMSALLLKIFIYSFKISKLKAGVSKWRWCLHLSPALSRSPSPSRSSHREWERVVTYPGPKGFPQAHLPTVTHPARASGSCRKTYSWVWRRLTWMRTIRDHGEGKERNFGWWEVAPSQGSAFSLQTQHSGNGIRAEETGKRGEARGDQAGLHHRAE